MSSVNTTLELMYYCNVFRLRRDIVRLITQPFGARIIFLILAHPVYKMWKIQEPNMLELWNKLHFEERKTENIQHVYNIQYLYLLNKYIKCNFGG